MHFVIFFSLALVKFSTPEILYLRYLENASNSTFIATGKVPGNYAKVKAVDITVTLRLLRGNNIPEADETDVKI